jgi:hypothetical protein
LWGPEGAPTPAPAAASAPEAEYCIAPGLLARLSPIWPPPASGRFPACNAKRIPSDCHSLAVASAGGEEARFATGVFPIELDTLPIRLAIPWLLARIGTIRYYNGNFAILGGQCCNA